MDGPSNSELVTLKHGGFSAIADTGTKVYRKSALSIADDAWDIAFRIAYGNSESSQVFLSSIFADSAQIQLLKRSSLRF